MVRIDPCWQRTLEGPVAIDVVVARSYTYSIVFLTGRNSAVHQCADGVERFRDDYWELCASVYDGAVGSQPQLTTAGGFGF